MAREVDKHSTRGGPRHARLAALAGLVLVAAAPLAAVDEHRKVHTPKVWIWIGPDQLRNLPMTGPGWDARGAPWFENRGVYYYAQQSATDIVVGALDERRDVYALAKALVSLRLRLEPVPPEDPEPYRAAAQEACLNAIGTELLGPEPSTLSLGRNLFALVIAANLIEWDNSVPGRQERDFRRWVGSVRRELLPDGSTVQRSMIQAHEERPNNWGLMCGASRLAAALYLEDPVEEERCWDIFRRWLGDTTSPFEFRLDDWGELSWQHDPLHPAGINPMGARKIDCFGTQRPIGGAMPDDMRRAGPFCAIAPCAPDWTWPSYRTSDSRNYNWSAMQAVLAQGVLHARRGRDPWMINDLAVGRALYWLYHELRFPVTDAQAGDDDYWQAHLANQVYPLLGLPETVATKPGHQIGFTDWTTLEPSWP
jgi:hypothetical protein